MNHLISQKKFEILIDGHTAELNYLVDNNTMSINRTYVPAELRGKGLAGKLNQAALEFAKNQNYKVAPVCSYTASYIDKHKEYQELLVI